MIPVLFDSLPLLYIAKEDFARRGSYYALFIAPEHILTAARKFLDEGYHLEDIGGLDTRDGALVVYHFDHFTTPLRLSLHALAPHDNPVFPSITPVYSGAEWHERETQDFFGYTFTGISNSNPLLLDYPMRDLKPLHKDPKDRSSLYALTNAGQLEVLFCDTSFTVMNAPAESGPAEAQPENKG